ncbi:ATP-binding protein [Spirillospora sp. NPDC127506]
MRGPDEDDDDGLRWPAGDARTVRQVFDAAPAAIVGLDGPNHTVVAANAAGRGLLGADPIGREIRDLVPEAVGQQLIGALDRPFATGVPELITEWRVQLGAGEGLAPDDVYIDGAVVPRRAPDGTVTGLVAVVRDVTSRVRDRRARRRSPRPSTDARDAVGVLQRQLLPPGLPVLPGLAIGGSYLLGRAESSAGGDWFDAVPLPDGRAALVVGDVAGHGVAASAAMGQLRAVLHDRLDHTGDIAGALAAAGRLAGRLPAARAATVCVAAVDRLTAQTLELLVRATGHTDDIALLAAQLTDPPSPLLLDMRADPAAIPAARKALDEWLYDLGARTEDVAFLRHGVGELVTNAVEHAYGSPPGNVRLRAAPTSRGTVEVEVSDRGRWLEHRHDTDRGRGLAMASDFVDELGVETAPSGTTATVRHRLLRPARLLTSPDFTPPEAPPDSPGLLLILDQPSPGAPRIRVDGPVDSATAAQLREELQLRTRGGTRPLTVDLTGVTHLASAGVAVLHEADTRTAALGHPLTLYAPAGSPAHHVLTTAALPHTTTDPG